MTLIDETLILARKLVELLEDPHPGLLTWNDAVTSIIIDLRQLVK